MNKYPIHPPPSPRTHTHPHTPGMANSILAIFVISKLTQNFLAIKFHSIGLLVQQNKSKIDFQDGHFGFQNRTILAILGQNRFSR